MEMVEDEILSHQVHQQSYKKNAAVEWRDEIHERKFLCEKTVMSLHV
jgi:hypothetical protein